MNAFLRIEFARAFRRKWFVVSLAIGCAIALYHFFTDVLPVGLQIDVYKRQACVMVPIGQ